MNKKSIFTISLTIFMAMTIFLSNAYFNKSFAEKSFAIAATVNKDAISENDVLDRMKLVFASSGVRNNKENRAQAYPQALNSLIEEQLQVQEARRQKVDVSDEVVLEGFAGMAKQNSMTADQFDVVIAQQGIPKATLLNKIKAQIAWRGVIGQVLRPQIDVSENDINARLDRLKANIGKTEYQTAEIFLPITEVSKEAETKGFAKKLASEIQAGRVLFSVIAAQFSKSSTARKGGLIGWVQEGQLPKELDVVVKSLNVKQVSPPIKSLSGYYVLTVLNKRTISEETLPTADSVLNEVGIERLDRLQQRYLQDIRATAFIDRRDQ